MQMIHAKLCIKKFFNSKILFYLNIALIILLIITLFFGLTGCISLSRIEKTADKLEEFNEKFRNKSSEDKSLDKSEVVSGIESGSQKGSQLVSEEGAESGVIDLLDSLGVGKVKNYPSSVYDVELNEKLGEFKNQLIDIPREYYNVLYTVYTTKDLPQEVVNYYNSEMKNLGWQKDLQNDSEKGFFALWHKEGYEGVVVEFIVVTGSINFENRSETVILRGFVIHEAGMDQDNTAGATKDESKSVSSGEVYFENPGYIEGEGLLDVKSISMGIEDWKKWLQGIGDNSVLLKDDPMFVKVAEFKRKCDLNDGGAAGIFFPLNIDLKRFSSVKIWLIGKVLYEEGGNIANVNPSFFPEGAVQVRIKYIDSLNNEKEWYHGFFYSNVIYYDKENFSLVTKDRWFWYISPNLLELEDKPQIIKEIKVYGFGWNFTGQVADVNIIGS